MLTAPLVDKLCDRPHADATPPHSAPSKPVASTSGGSDSEQPSGGLSGGGKTGLIAAASAVAGVLLLLGGGCVFKDQIKAFMNFFITAVDDWGPLGYLAYAVVYAGALQACLSVCNRLARATRGVPLHVDMF